MMKSYEVTFKGGPVVAVSAINEQSAIIEARLDATDLGTRGVVTNVHEIQPAYWTWNGRRYYNDHPEADDKRT